jgi:hypothetical protein
MNDAKLSNSLAPRFIQGFCRFISLQMGNTAPPDYDALPA